MNRPVLCGNCVLPQNYHTRKLVEITILPSVSDVENELKAGLPSSEKVGPICFNTNPLKMMKNAFYFNLKALFVLKVFKFWPDFSDHARKRLDKKAKVNFQIYGASYLETNNYNTHIAEYFKK